MSLPNLRKYYHFAQLKYVVLWCDSGYEAKWKDMERECRGTPIKAMIGDNKLMTTLQEHLSPFVSFTLHTWFGVVKQFNLWNQVKKIRWVGHDTDFKLNGMDSRFKYWTNMGITAYCNIMEKNTLKSFQALKEKYNLENQDFFRYLQVRQYFMKEVREKETAESNEIIITKPVNLLFQGFSKALQRAEIIPQHT